MATEIKVVSGLLTIGDAKSFRVDKFTVSSSAGGVRIYSGTDNRSEFVKTTDAKIGSTTFTDPKVLFAAIAALSSAPGGGEAPAG